MALDGFLSTVSDPSNFSSIALVFVLIAVTAVIEAIVPLRLRDRSGRPHALPNLVLTFLTLGVGLVLGSAILVGLAWFEASRLGLLRAYDIAPFWAVAIGVLALCGGLLLALPLPRGERGGGAGA